MSASGIKDKLLAYLDNEAPARRSISLDGKGTWHIDTEAIYDRADSMVLSRLIVERQGQFILSLDDREIPVAVEDAPLMVTGIRAKGTANHEDFFITLSNGTTEELDFETLYFRIATRGLYCRISNGMVAKFDMVPMIQFLDRLEEDDFGFYMYIYAERKEIPRI